MTARLLLSLLCLTLLSTVHAAPTYSMAEATVPMKAIKVGAHSYYVQGLPGAASSANQGFMSNAGFVVTCDGVVVFDALASPPLAKKLVQVIRAISQQPIKRVIVSHYHADHIYGLQVFQDLGAEIWAHRSGQQYLASGAAAKLMEQRRETLFPWVDDSSRLVAADRWLDGDVDFEMGGVRFELRHVGPAHAPDDR